MKPRLYSLPCICGLTFMLAACSTAPSVKPSSLTDTSQSVESKPFDAPFDPSMGQVVIAVSAVNVSAPVPAGFANLGQTVRSQFANLLAASGNFVVADREALADIASEVELASAGAIDPRDQPSVGRLAGPRYLIKVDVTEFQEQVVGQSKGSGFQAGVIGAIGGIFAQGQAKQIFDAIQIANPTMGGGKQTIEGIVGMEIRLVDVDTGAIVTATRAHGQLTSENSTSVFAIAGISAGDSRFNSSVVAHATRAALEDAVNNIHGAIRDRISREQLSRGGASTSDVVLLSN